MGANAQTSVPAFTAGQVLTAAQMTQVNTGIPVFADSTARDAAFGGTGEKTLAEGQMAYLEDTNATQYYDGSSWAAVAGGKILQVVQTVKTDTFSTTSTSFVDATGLSANITPTSNTNKVLVMLTVQASNSSASHLCLINLVRDSTNIGQSTGGGSGNQTAASYTNSTASGDFVAVNVLDSPATTSATTYKVQVAASAGGTAYVGRYAANTAYTSISTLTLLEVLA